MGKIVAFWNRLGTFLGGAAQRTIGIQSGTPARYTQAAVPVTIDSALATSAAWACTRLTAECIGALPIHVYDVSKDGVKTKNTEHWLAKLFAGKVNPYQTRQEFFETLGYQFVLTGNCYALKKMGELSISKGSIVSLLPFMSMQMEVELLRDGAVTYRYQDGVDVKVYAADRVWHNKLFGNGIIGLSPLEYARNSIGIAQAAEEATTKIYKNGGKPSGVLTIDKTLTKEQREQIRAKFAELAEGGDDRLFVLEAGLKYQQVSMSPTDIEMLSSRRFQIEDICRFFGVPSVLVNDMSQATAWGSGIEQILQGWYKLGLRPYLTRFQDSMRCNLLSKEEQLTMRIEFDLEELLNPTFYERLKAGKEGVTGGLITPNEWRKEEGLPPQSGGDKLFMQQQMLPIDDPNRGKATANNFGGSNEDKTTAG